MSRNESLFINSMTLKGKDTQISFNPIIAKNRINEIDQEIKMREQEIVLLLKEKSRLCERLSSIEERIPPLNTEAATEIKGEDKARFILNLFSPRLDIFATRQKRKDTGKTVYYPKCSNLWKEGCHRKIQGDKTQCADCPLNEKEKLTTQAIWNNTFANDNPDGIGAIGIYPLKPGNTTRFIAIDLDEKDWEESAKAILITARNAGISMVAEKSFSGNGVHLWIFFAEDIAASDARKLAILILDKTRERFANINIESYDRLFPSQDKLGDKGFGNLILLPLVGSAAHRGCTLFLDETLSPYPMKDQIAFLSSIHRHTLEEVRIFIDTFSSDQFELKLDNEDLNPGWRMWIPKISKEDIISPLILYRSSGVSFDKSALSQKAQEALRRIATISNPEYYKRLSRNDGWRPNGLCSRIPLYEENERVIKLPRGMYKIITKILTSPGISFSEEDHRTFETGLEAETDIQLTKFQQDAFKAAMQNECGIIASATSSGKTVVAMSIIAARKERTIILVNSVSLMNQWLDDIHRFLKINTVPSNEISSKKGRKALRGSVGSLGGSRKDKLSGIVDVATIQSIPSKLKENGETFASQYGLVIIDECHHIAADEARAAIRNLNAKYVYGLTATPKRGDGLERIEYAECGNIIFRYEAADLAYSRGIAQYVIPRFLDTPISNINKNIRFTDLMDMLSANSERNNAIVEDIEGAFGKGRKILVITRRIEQNHAIGELLQKSNLPATILDGTTNKAEARRILNEFRANSVHSILISTDKFLGEGIDIPSLDTLFLASPFMKETTIKQCAGRLARIADRKTTTWIYDYIDFRIPRLNYMYMKRLRTYKELGYTSFCDTSIPKEEMLYTPESFTQSFVNDVETANKSIIISSSYIASSAISKMIIAAINLKVESGIIVTLRISNRAKETKGYQAIKQRLLNPMVKIELRENTANYAIIDKQICWYGDFSILGQSTKSITENRSILRISDTDLAECLISESVSLT